VILLKARPVARWNVKIFFRKGSATETLRVTGPPPENCFVAWPGRFPMTEGIEPI